MSNRIDANDIIEVFNQCFESEYGTTLVGGAAEPFYEVTRQPENFPMNGANKKSFNDTWATIYFREDFAASALHEVAHWCRAGTGRRQQNDYGYWYEGQRDLAAQLRFEAVEVKPQALEWIFSTAAGLPFRVSADNLSLENHDTKAFRRSVRCAVQETLNQGLNARARRFAIGLARRAGQDERHALSATNFQELPN